MSYSWARRLLDCAAKGFNAFEAGKKREDCPYAWARTGFNRQRRDYWMAGFDEAATIASDQRLFDRARAEALKKKV
jgi:ribosome modulation factor